MLCTVTTSGFNSNTVTQYTVTVYTKVIKVTTTTIRDTIKLMHNTHYYNSAVTTVISTLLHSKGERQSKNLHS